MAFFKVPDVLLFNRKVDWYYLKIAFALQLIVLALAAAVRLAGLAHCRLATALMIPTRLLGCASTFGVGISFCLATWKVFGVWAIYIMVVSGMSYLAFIATI